MFLCSVAGASSLIYIRSHVYICIQRSEHYFHFKDAIALFVSLDALEILTMVAIDGVASLSTFIYIYMYTYAMQVAIRLDGTNRLNVYTKNSNQMDRCSHCSGGTY